MSTFERARNSRRVGFGIQGSLRSQFKGIGFCSGKIMKLLRVGSHLEHLGISILSPSSSKLFFFFFFGQANTYWGGV